MSLTDRLFRRSKGPPSIHLPTLQAAFTAATVRLTGAPVDTELLRARLADGFRSAGVVPLLPDDFDSLSKQLDEPGWRRLALATMALDLESVRPAVAASTREAQNAAFFELAQHMPLLTLELLGQSPLRVEEFARQFIARLGAAIQGESSAESKRRLERLDYAKLLAEAERAKKAAKDRVERLQQLQDEKEQSRPRRGKF